MQPTTTNFFKRQITLKEIGKEGQKKLEKTSILIIGCGGLGSPIAVYLAMSGIGKIHLVDFDTVDVTNLHRQVFYTLEDIGKPKAQVLADFIKQRNPFTKITVSNIPITKSNILQIVVQADIIVDATDSLPTKYLINDACVMRNKALVYGSLYKFDGYVASLNVLQKDNTYSSNLRDAFPEMTTDIPNCEEAGTLNAIVGIIATMQVNEVLKLALGIGQPLVNQLQIINSLQNSSLKMKLNATYSKEKITALFEKEDYFDAGCQITKDDLQITALNLKEIIEQQNNTLEIIAVLPDLALPFSISKTIPISTFDAQRITIDPKKTYVMVCQRGKNSFIAAQKIKAVHPNAKVLSLAGGISKYKSL